MRTPFAIPVVLILLGCDGGLQPPPPDPGIGGTIRFVQSSWPPADSLQGLWLFASKEYPLDSSRVVAGVLVEPRFVFLYPSLQEPLPLYVSQVRFDFPLEPGSYPYIGVIQQLKPQLVITSFRVVGVLHFPGNDTIPRPLTIAGDFIDGLELNVDFNAPPPQPFQ